MKPEIIRDKLMGIGYPIKEHIDGYIGYGKFDPAAVIKALREVAVECEKLAFQLESDNDGGE